MITARAIDVATSKARASLKDIWLTDPGVRGRGRFTIRCTPSGARICMYRYTRPDGTRDTLRVGDYDPQGVAGLTLHQAREMAGELVRLAGTGNNVRVVLLEREEAKEAAAEAALAARRNATRGSLAAMYRVYANTLQGRESHYDVLSVFKLHLSGPFPDLAARPAAKVKAEELRDVLARLIEAGKGRTAAKLRAYLRAAFGMAMRAGLGSDAARGADGLRHPGQPGRPASEPGAVLEGVGPRADAAGASCLLAPPGSSTRKSVAGRADGLHVPRRPAAHPAAAPDTQASGRVRRYRDAVGPQGPESARQSTSAYMLPILDDLMPVIRRRLAQTEDAESPMFSTNGRVPLRKETVALLVTEIAKDMKKAGELERGPFSMRDLRRTAETHMAALGISSDVRAQIQSHGLGGIQARHYDRHDYMPEKRTALALWVRRLNPMAPSSRRVPTSTRSGRGRARAMRTFTTG